MHTGAVGPTRPARTTISPRRIIVAGMLTALMAGYIGPVRGYLDQRAELRDERGKLAMLVERRDAFRTQLAALGQDPVLEARARQLGSTNRPVSRSMPQAISMSPTSITTWSESSHRPRPEVSSPR